MEPGVAVWVRAGEGEGDIAWHAGVIRSKKGSAIDEDKVDIEIELLVEGTLERTGTLRAVTMVRIADSWGCPVPSSRCLCVLASPCTCGRARVLCIFKFQSHHCGRCLRAVLLFRVF